MLSLTQMFYSLPTAWQRTAFKQSHWNKACDTETEGNKTSRGTDGAQAGKEGSKKEQKSTAIHNHTDGYQCPHHCIIY